MRLHGYVGPTIWLTGLWVVLWRSTTAATLITGVVLAVALTWFVTRSDARLRHKVRAVPLIQFFAHMAVALVRSNVVLAREILTPTDSTQPGILEIQLPSCSELVLTVIGNSISLTPGTLTLELRAETSTLAVHVLHLSDVDAARDEVEHLHRLISSALVELPTDEEAAA